MNHPTKIHLLFVSLFALAITSTSHAQYGSWLERFRVDNSLSASLGYSSNVGLNESGIGDFFVGARFNSSITRKFKVVTLGISLDAAAQHYFENDQINDQNVSFGWIIATEEEFGTRRTIYDLDFSLSETVGQNNEIDGIVTEGNIAASGSMSYLLTRQTSLGASISYSKRDPRNVKTLVSENEITEVDNLSAIDTFTASAWSSWIASPDTSFRLTGSISEVGSDRFSSQDGTIYSLSVGMTRQLSAKLDWNLTAGGSRRELDRAESTTTPTFSTSIDYILNERSRFSLNASRQFDSGLTGSNSISNTLAFDFTRELSPKSSFTTGVSYILSELEFNSDPMNPVTEDRSTLEVHATISRALNQWARIQLSSHWSNTESDSALRGDYDRFSIQVTATARF